MWRYGLEAGGGRRGDQRFICVLEYDMTWNGARHRMSGEPLPWSV